MYNHLARIDNSFRQLDTYKRRLEGKEGAKTLFEIIENKSTEEVLAVGNGYTVSALVFNLPGDDDLLGSGLTLLQFLDHLAFYHDHMPSGGTMTTDRGEEKPTEKKGLKVQLDATFAFLIRSTGQKRPGSGRQVKKLKSSRYLRS